jgi:phosphoribosylformylglycinamidine cyclo-ligase
VKQRPKEDAAAEVPPSDAGRSAYRQAGVDLGVSSSVVEAIGLLAREAARPEVVSGIGGFAGLFSLGDGRLLAAATDGVGTKLEVARAARKLDTVGIDLVAMCANDVVCTGAAPLFFLDYVAVGRVVPEEIAQIVSGVAAGCRAAGCALLGGETAEHPGTMEEGRFDLAGFCVGLVQQEALLGPHRVRPGDALLGLASSGLHSNGFSLVRRVLLDAHPTDSLNEFIPALGRHLGEELLEPTTIYVRPLLALAQAGLAEAAAHITGGGLLENVPRALPEGLGAEIDPSSWSRPAVFDLVAERAGVEARELFGVLNMGIGMIVVAPRSRADEAMAACQDAGVRAAIIGRVVKEPGVSID